MGPLPKLVITVALGLTSNAGVSQLTNSLSSEDPSVSWSTADGSTVSGRHTLVVGAAPSSSGTATIKKICLSQDGAAVAPYSSSNTKGFTYVSFSTSSGSEIGNGCWSTGITSYGSNVSFSFDSTTWENGSRTYSVTVTDSAGRSATSKSITINHNNPQPNVSIRRFELSNSGLHKLELEAMLPQTNVQWSSLCIVGPTTGVSFATEGWTAAPNNCWLPPGKDTRASMVLLKVDTLASDSSLHAFTLEMRDNIGRKGSVRHEFSWVKPAITVEILGVAPDTRITGILNLAIQSVLEPELQSRVKIVDFCLTVQGQKCASSSNVGAHSVQFVFDSSQYPDGNHVLEATIKDTLGRTASRSFPIIIANGLPQIGEIQFIEPKKKGSSQIIEVVVGVSRSSKGAIRYREVTRKNSIVIPLQLAVNDSPELRVAIAGLLKGKTYVFEIWAENANGRLVSKQVRYKVK